MNNNQLYSTISNNLQKNSNSYSNNEIFGLLSILVLLEITGIYQTDVKSLPESDSNSKQNNMLSSLGNISNVGDLTSLLGQLQGNGNGDGGNNLQQMLPLLMGALGGNSGSGDMDIGKITNIMSALKNSQGNNSKEEHINVENEEISQDDIDDDNDNNKKKVSAK